jgi:uncharacterized small protein (DUF1192 family)
MDVMEHIITSGSITEEELVRLEELADNFDVTEVQEIASSIPRLTAEIRRLRGEFTVRTNERGPAIIGEDLSP